MTTNPLPCRFFVGGHSIAEKARLHLSRQGGGTAAGELPGGSGLSLYWLTPDLLLSALRKSATRVVRFTLTGTFVGSYYLRSGREVGEYGSGSREVSKLDVLLEGSASAIRFQLSGELFGDTGARIGSEPLTPAPFDIDITVPLGELENAIQDAAAKPVATQIASLLARPSKFLSG